MSYLKDREIWLSNVPTGNPPAGYFWKFIQNGKVVVRDSSGNNQIMVATSGSQAITGSLTVTGGITGTVSSASYVEYSNVANKPALVSGSAQITGFGIFATTGSNAFQANQVITGSFTVVTGSAVELQVTNLGVNIGSALTDSHIISGSLRVNPNGLFVSGSGNVGIGTTNPQSIFHIGAPASANAGVKPYTGLSSTHEGFLFDYYYNTSASNIRVFDIAALGFAVNGAGGSELRFLTVPQTTTNTPLERMRITAAGNVGIGTDTPEALLHINAANAGGQGGYVYIDNPATSTLNSSVGIRFSTSTGGSFAGVYTGNIANIVTNASDGASALTFGTWDGSTAAERMRITSGGNIVIGNTVASNVGLTIYGTNSATIYQTPTSGTGAGNGLYVGQIGDVSYIWNYNNFPTVFATNNTERMRITSGGNVGIGTTSPSAILDVRKPTASGDTQFNFVNSQNSSSGNTSITSTIYLGFFDDSNGLANVNKIVSGKSGDYTSAPTANSFLAFHTTSANSTAERMRITSGGDILIGGISSSTYSTSNRTAVVASGTTMALFGLVTGGVNKGYFYSDGTNINLMSESASGVMSFGTNNTERMRITSVGRTLLIGTTSSSYSDTTRALLELNGLSGGTALLSLRVNDSQRAYFYHNNTDLYIEQMLNPGRIYVISFSGGVYLTAGATSWTANSDERLKNINGEIENAVDKLNQLRAVNFSWKNNTIEKQNLGLIAQDVEKVFPELIDKNKLPSKANKTQQDETEYLGVRYQELIPVLVKAIQEQQTLIESLKSRIEILEQ